MRKFMFILVVLGLSLTLSAQDKMDVVHLKNGQRVVGSVIKPLDEQGVQIMTTEGDVYTYKAAEVRRVTREIFRHQNQHQSILAHDGQGFTNTTTLGYAPGVGTVGEGGDAYPMWAIHTVNGYHLNRMWSAGLGLGMEWHKDFELVPLYGDLRFFPLAKEWAPYVYAQAGYGLSFLNKKQADGGALLGLGAGLQRSISPDFALVASLGYRYQGNALEGVDLSAHFLQLQFGVKF